MKGFNSIHSLFIFFLIRNLNGVTKIKNPKILYTVYNLRQIHVVLTDKEHPKGSENVHFMLQNTNVLCQFLLKFYKVMCTYPTRTCGIKQYMSLSRTLLVFFKHFEKMLCFRW